MTATAEQEARYAAARDDLRRALTILAAAARAAARTGDVAPVYGHVDEVRRAEEAADIAADDLATARGENG